MFHSVTDTSESPVLNPYPSFESHRFDGDNIPDVVSVFRVWADNCDRLWVLDTGMEDMLGTINRTQAAPPALLIYDLSTDQLLRKYVIPTEQTVSTSHFGNVVVEDSSCDETFAYLADIANPGLVVYSWASNDSWLVTHHYFNADPLVPDLTHSRQTLDVNDLKLSRAAISTYLDYPFNGGTVS